MQNLTLLSLNLGENVVEMSNEEKFREDLFFIFFKEYTHYVTRHYT